MSLLPDNWELASLLAKLLLYIGAFSLAGGSLTAWRYSNANRVVLASTFSYILIGAVVGFQGVLLGFFVQVGLINDSGIAGMFDWGMISILLDTGLGDVTLLRLLAFMLAGASSILLLQKLKRAELSLQNPVLRLSVAMLLLALLGLAFSHRLTGHISVLSPIAQTSIVLHFLAFSLWIGCLYPFLILSRNLDVSTLQKSLKQFANNAIALLLILLLAGGLMLFELLDSPRALIDTDYGRALLLKLFLVLGILAVAAVNKLLLVPALTRTGNVTKLRTSIRLELVMAMAILVVTSYLSTIVGPLEH